MGVQSSLSSSCLLCRTTRRLQRRPRTRRRRDLNKASGRCARVLLASSSTLSSWYLSLEVSMCKDSVSRAYTALCLPRDGWYRRCGSCSSLRQLLSCSVVVSVRHHYRCNAYMGLDYLGLHP